MEVIKPPTPLPRAFKDKPSFFLAGSIEMGTAENWQAQIERSLQGYNCTVLNPRRDDWDSGLRQSINEPKFKEQVTWELEGQERAHHILMYFHPATKAPITLLEMGLGIMGAGGELVVCCPEGFYRKGNVDVVCERYDVPQVSGLDGLILYAIEEIKRWEKTHAGSLERRLNG